MSREINADGSYLEVTFDTPIGATTSKTVFMWVYGNTDAWTDTNNAFMSLGPTGFADVYRLMQGNNNYYGNVPGAGVSTSTVGFFFWGSRTEKWIPLMFVIDSANASPQATVYIANGSGAATESASGANTAWDSLIGNILRIGISGTTSNTTQKNVLVGEVCVWESVLTEANFDTLKGGAIPTTVDSGNVKCYYPLDDSDLTDQSGNGEATMSSNSTTLDAEHPITTANAPTVNNPGTHDQSHQEAEDVGTIATSTWFDAQGESVSGYAEDPASCLPAGINLDTGTGAITGDADAGEANSSPFACGIKITTAVGSVTESFQWDISGVESVTFDATSDHKLLDVADSLHASLTSVHYAVWAGTTLADMTDANLVIAGTDGTVTDGVMTIQFTGSGLGSAADVIVALFHSGKWFLYTEVTD